MKKTTRTFRPGTLFDHNGKLAIFLFAEFHYFAANEDGSASKNSIYTILFMMNGSIMITYMYDDQTVQTLG